MRTPILLFVLALLLALVACSGNSSGGRQTPPPPTLNAIQIENQQPGNSDWTLTSPAVNHEMEGYASAASVNQGDPITFFINTPDSTYNLEVFRMGWYNGAGARRLLGPVSLPGTAQPMPTMDPATGLMECHWSPSYTFTIPQDSASSSPADHWVSGIYLARLTAGTTGLQSYIIFVVRDDTSHSSLVFHTNEFTYQAYNPWGGKSLYHSYHDGIVDANRAYMVSMNRPYWNYLFPNEPVAQFGYGEGAGDFLYAYHRGGWEYQMVRFLEKNGYDVSYLADIDIHQRPALLHNHKAILNVGHGEYWTYDMRDTFEAARDAGIHQAYFGANFGYWQVRLQPDSQGNAERTIVCYKDVSLDPYSSDGNPDHQKYVTYYFRDPPVNRPEEQLVGVQYVVSPVDSDIVITNASNPVFNGSGATNGMLLTGLLGYEVDREFGNQPPQTIVLADSYFTLPGHPPFHSQATIYTASSGAIVFAAGTLQWSWGLDNYHPLVPAQLENPVVVQVTENVLSQFGVPKPQ